MTCTQQSFMVGGDLDASRHRGVQERRVSAFDARVADALNGRPVIAMLLGLRAASCGRQ